MKKFLITLLLNASLVACNGGSTNSNEEGDNFDMQKGNGQIESDNSKIIFSYQATNCMNISTNSRCLVVLTYNTLGDTLYDGRLSMRTYDGISKKPTHGFTSNITTCPNVSPTQQICSFTIDATESASLAIQIVSLMANDYQIARFKIRYTAQ